MNSQGSILVGCFEDVAWIRVEGEASHRNSPQVREFTRERIDSGTVNFVVDLENCPGMDSTFMGMIASLTCEEEYQDSNQAKVHIINCSETARQCLDDLGLTQIIPLEELDNLDSITFIPLDKIEYHSKDQEEMILLSHEMLSSINDRNKTMFSTVIEALNVSRKKE